MSTETEMSGSDLAVVFFWILIYVIGVVGNLFVIFVILFLKEYKKITHWYVLQMALADVIFLQNIPPRVTEEVNDGWTYPALLCTGRQTVLFVTYYASVMFLTIMAIDRYVAVCHSTSATVSKIRSPRNVHTLSAVIWIIALGMSVPAMLYATTSGTDKSCGCRYFFLVFPMDPRYWCVENGFEIPSEANFNTSLEQCMEIIFPAATGESCLNFEVPSADPPANPDTFNPFSGSDESSLFSTDFSAGSQQAFDECFYPPGRPGLTSYLFFNFIAMFLIPFLVLVACYSLVVHRLFSSISPSTASGTTGRSEKKKRKVTILCILLAALFTICWLPFYSVRLAKVVRIDADERFCEQLSTAASLIAYLGSAINPYLYNFLGSFKMRIKQIRSSTAVQSIHATTCTARVPTVPQASNPGSSIVPFTYEQKIATPSSGPKEISLSHVGTKLS